MKKLFICFSLFTLGSSLLTKVYAQDETSFYKHALIVSLGTELDVYNIKETYSVNGYPSLSKTTTAQAGSKSYPLTVEYGVNKWLGLGIVAKFDNYFVSKDTATGYTPSAEGYEFGLLVNFHLLRTHHSDLLLGVDLGSSHFTYTIDSYNDQVYGSGGWGDIHAAYRYYFGRFGLSASMGFPTMNYTLTGNNANWSLGQDILASWKASGFTFGFGLQYRFLN